MIRNVGTKIRLLSFIPSMATDLGSLIHTLPPEQRKEVRDLEKVFVRRCKNECSLLFNSTCIKENLLPNYSNLYVGMCVYRCVYVSMCVSQLVCMNVCICVCVYVCECQSMYECCSRIFLLFYFML